MQKYQRSGTGGNTEDANRLESFATHSVGFCSYPTRTYSNQHLVVSTTCIKFMEVGISNEWMIGMHQIGLAMIIGGGLLLFHGK